MWVKYGDVGIVWVADGTGGRTNVLKGGFMVDRWLGVGTKWLVIEGLYLCACDLIGRAN